MGEPTKQDLDKLHRVLKQQNVDRELFQAAIAELEEVGQRNSLPNLRRLIGNPYWPWQRDLWSLRKSVENCIQTIERRMCHDQAPRVLLRPAHPPCAPIQSDEWARPPL